MTDRSRLHAAFELTALRLGQPVLGPMISRGQFDRIAEHVREVLAASRMLPDEDKDLLSKALDDDSARKEFAIALNGLLHGKRSMEERFGHWMGVLSRHGLATWPIATIWPFLLHPQRYFPIFPAVFNGQLTDAEATVAPGAAPDWSGYVASQRLAHQLRKARAMDSLLDLYQALTVAARQ
ncbi:MAG: hypothetical protein EA370_02020 [Wenzhouxiangella sp.]|nr:MAG: hypothetical protein EA370_02020 [Wenzhouxiangella sp.]